MRFEQSPPPKDEILNPVMSVVQLLINNQLELNRWLPDTNTDNQWINLNRGLQNYAFFISDFTADELNKILFKLIILRMKRNNFT